MTARFGLKIHRKLSAFEKMNVSVLNIRAAHFFKNGNLQIVFKPKPVSDEHGLSELFLDRHP